MSQELYYTAPSKEVFDDMKRACIELWMTYDDTHGYATEKISQIANLENVGDNFMYMMAMFDAGNQQTVLGKVLPATAEEFNKRIVWSRTIIL